MTRRRFDAPRRASHERWLVSYADFITLLFAVFTALYASSTVDAGKVASVAASMHHVFAGDQPAGVLPPAGGGPDVVPGAGDRASLARIQRAIAAEMRAELAAGHVELETDARGIVVSIRESGSFPVGRADLPPEAEALFVRLGARLRELPNAIRVEGHTDDVPIRTAKFDSNWELSTARATHVVGVFVRKAGIDASRLSAAGYGEFHPRVPNDSAESRARNRRVDVVILNAATRAAEEPRGQ